MYTLKTPKTYLLSILFVCFYGYSQAAESTDSVSMKFDLGEVTVFSNQFHSKQNVSATDIDIYEKENVSDALNLIPGVISVAGAKEDMVYVRGFNQRQIPFYFDGVPISLPYDGFLDLDMLSASKISQINIVSGTESMLYGPNALGGAVNIVSTKPKDGYSGRVKIGTITNGKYTANASLGYANDKFYTTASYSIVDYNNYKLSDNYTPTSTLEDGGTLANSFKKNTQLNVKVGYTPKAGSEYAIAYVNNDGEKGIPSYLGTNGSARFWQFPDYHTQSLYFISKTKLSEELSLKTRLYYTRFEDNLTSYDDATYTTMTKGYAFSDFYDDYSTGAIATLTHNKGNNSVSFDAQYKYDSHKEFNEGETAIGMLDQSASVSLVDSYSFDKLSLHGGISSQYQDGLKAEYFNSADELTEYPMFNTLVYNGEFGLKYKIDGNNELGAGIAYKTRFPTMKDRYSLRMGKSIANPDLKEENATNYNLDYSGTYFNKLQVMAGVFYSSLKDAITSVYGIDTSNVSLYQYQNAAKAEYLGGDISVSYAIIKSLTIKANYAYVKQNNLSAPDVKFTDVPNHTAQAALIYRFKKKSYVNLAVESYSDRYSTSDGIKTSGYTLLNTKAAYEVYKSMIVVEGGINNILDKSYEVHEGYPMMGRNAFVSVVCEF